MSEPFIDAAWFDWFCDRLGLDAQKVLAEAAEATRPMVKVPVTWCVVHEWEATDRPDRHCDRDYDDVERRPCRLVPLYRYPTETP